MVLLPVTLFHFSHIQVSETGDSPAPGTPPHPPCIKSCRNSLTWKWRGRHHPFGSLGFRSGSSHGWRFGKCNLWCDFHQGNHHQPSPLAELSREGQVTRPGCSARPSSHLPQPSSHHKRHSHQASHQPPPSAGTHSLSCLQFTLFWAHKECSNYHIIALISHSSKVMLKILQARLQQYMNCELPDVQAGFRKGRGTRDQIAKIHLIIKKARKFQKNIYFCFIDYAKAFDCVDHNKLWKILQEMGIPGHLTCLSRNLYVGQEAKVRTGHRKTDWFHNRKRSTSRLSIVTLLI